jgi:hypothetical protein
LLPVATASTAQKRDKNAKGSRKKPKNAPLDSPTDTAEASESTTDMAAVVCGVGPTTNPTEVNLPGELHNLIPGWSSSLVVFQPSQLRKFERTKLRQPTSGVSFAS